MSARWTHTLRRPLSDAADRAVRRALSADWQSGTRAERAADLRAYLLASAYVLAHFSRRAGGDAGAEPAGESLVIRVDDPGLARPLAQTWELFRGSEPIPAVVETTEGEDTAGPWPLVVGAVVVSLVQAAAVAYVAHQAVQVVDRELARRASVRELLRSDAVVLELLGRHAEREREAGRALPLTDAERRALDALEARQRELASGLRPPALRAGAGALLEDLLALGTAVAAVALSVTLFD